MTRLIPTFNLLACIFGMQFNADPAQLFVNARLFSLASRKDA
jgi:hypothetical protein